MSDHNWTRTNLEDDILWVPMMEAEEEIERLRVKADANARGFSDAQAEIKRLREVARKLFMELEGDDQHFENWLVKQGERE